MLSVYTLKHSFTPHFLFMTSRFTCSAKIETIGLTYNVGMPSSGKSRVMPSTAWRSVWHLTPSINNLQHQSIYIHDFRSHGDGSPWLQNLVESSCKAKQHHKCHDHQPISMSTILFLQFYNHDTGASQSVNTPRQSQHTMSKKKKNKRNYYQWSSFPSWDSSWSNKHCHISLPIFFRRAHQQPPMTLSTSSLSAFTLRFSSIRLLLATIMWSTSTIRGLIGCPHQAWPGSLEATCWWLFCLCMLTISCIL